MKKVAILTDFLNFDAAYSLCRVVAAQVKMLVGHEYEPLLLVRAGFDRVHSERYPGAEVKELDPGAVGDNRVEVTPESEGEVENLLGQMRDALEGYDVVLTHDLIYQPNMWKYHVASRRLAVERGGGLRWLHWVHSATAMNTVAQTGTYKEELEGRFPFSKLVVMHGEETTRKRNAFGYDLADVVTIPNPVDFLEHAHPAARQAVKALRLMAADVIAVYPCRLDRGKQPHLVIELFGHLLDSGYDARVVVCDFHSCGGDKVTYREEMKQQAYQRRVPLLFTSELEGEADGTPYSYAIPHAAVMDLMHLADVLVHPSRSESDPLIIPEAAWARCGLVLNFDNPAFRRFDENAVFGKFSSNIDIATGMPGETETRYDDRNGYFRHVAGLIAYQMEHNPVLALHAKMRKERSLEGVWPRLWAAVENA
jgi:glycosyltransferase involved in cell wall biosynthesis